MKKQNDGMNSLKMKIGYRNWRGLKYFLMILPFVIFVTMFSYIPLLGWIYGFCDYKPGRLFWQVDFVGLKHFKRLLTDSQLPRVMRNTLVMSGLAYATTWVPVALAIILNEIRNAKVTKLVQTITTLPNFISWIIVYGIASAIFSGSGLLNQIIEMVGLTPSTFGLIGDGDKVWGFQLALALWKGTGWSTIVYLAGIAGIDTELYDAAKVDGANRWKCIRHVTIPGILPTYVVILLLGVGNILSNGFDQYFQFWNSLVSDKIEVLDYYVYKMAFGSNQYSYSIAVGMLKSLIGIALLFSVNAFSKKVRGSSLI